MAPTAYAEAASLFDDTLAESRSWRTLFGLAIVLGVPLAAVLFVRRYPSMFEQLR